MSLTVSSEDLVWMRVSPFPIYWFDGKNNVAIANISNYDRRGRGSLSCADFEPVTPLSNKSEEFLQLKDYLMDTRGSTHSANYQIAQIFRIERDGEFERFDISHKASLDRRLLWHGSRCTNFGGILSQGLRIAPPEAPVSGYGTCMTSYQISSTGLPCNCAVQS
jgi:hypothetical protein